MMVGEDNKISTKVTKLFKEGTIKVLDAIGRGGKLRWKEIQDMTKLPVATLNRSLSLLKEMHFITKEEEQYRLTWVGDLLLDILATFGIVESSPSKEAEDSSTEKSIARDMVLSSLIMLFATLKNRGSFDLREFEIAMEEQKGTIHKVIENFEEGGLVSREGDKIIATDLLKNMDLIDIISL